VRCVQADAPTDATGTTYITWIGPSGVGRGGDGESGIRIGSGAVTTAKSRCWSWDTKLRGQLATTGPGAVAGNYICIVKNFDVQGSNLAIANSAEKVEQSDGLQLRER